MDRTLKVVLIAAAIIVGVLLVVPGLWGGGGWGGGMMGPGMMGGFGWGLGMPIFMVLFWGLIIWGIVALVRGVASPARDDATRYQAESSLEVLKKRYARGDISKEEYEEKKRDLA